MDSSRLSQAIKDLQDQTEFLDELWQNIQEYQAAIGSVKRAYEANQREVLLDRPPEAEAGTVTLHFFTPRVKEQLIWRMMSKVESIENVVKELRHRIKDTVCTIRQLLGKLDEGFSKYGFDFCACSNKDVIAMERALSIRKLAWIKLMEAQNVYLKKETM